MTNAQHTPGPWGLHIGNDYCRVLMKPTSCTDDYIAEVHSDGMGEDYEDDDANREANARLIAAAPELLAALKECAAYYAKNGGPRKQWDAAKAAIAKAEGK